VKSVVMTILMI